MNETPATQATATKAPKVLTGCQCGHLLGSQCTAQTFRDFAPGHDARMASNIAQVLVTGLEGINQLRDSKLDPAEDIQARIDEATTLVRDRFGAPLADKTNKAAMNLWAKVTVRQERTAARETVKADREAAKAGRAAARQAAKEAKAAAKEQAAAEPKVDGTVKVGRWTYPAIKVTASGSVARNEKRDGTGAWIDAAELAETFEAATA